MAPRMIDPLAAETDLDRINSLQHVYWPSYEASKNRWASRQA
jgi:hypothetical protein